MKVELTILLLCAVLGGCGQRVDGVSDSAPVVSSTGTPVIPVEAILKKRSDEVLKFTVYSMILNKMFYGDRWSWSFKSQNLVVSKFTILPSRKEDLPADFVSAEVKQQLLSKEFGKRDIERGYDVYGTLIFKKGNSLLDIWQAANSRNPRLSVAVGLSEVVSNSANTEALIYVEVMTEAGHEKAYCTVVFEDNDQRLTWHYL